MKSIIASALLLLAPAIALAQTASAQPAAKSESKACTTCTACALDA